MTGLIELKRKLAAATELLRRTTDPIEKSFLGGDVRELERMVEIASAGDPDVPIRRRPRPRSAAPAK